MTRPTPTLDLTPEGLRITTPTSSGSVIAWLEPWQVLALAEDARRAWGDRERNPGDEQAEDMGRRGTL